MKPTFPIDEEHFRTLYRSHRNSFLHWANYHYHCSEQQALDIFQDALIIYYNNLKKGKLADLQATVGTYLFGIGKNLLYQLKKKQKREVQVEEAKIKQLKEKDLTLFHKMEDDHNKRLLREAFRQLGEKCRELLRLVFYHNFTMESIKNRMNYNSEGVARTMKVKCLKQLRGVLKPLIEKS